MSNAVGLVAPRGTPAAVIARLSAAALSAAADAGLRDTFERNGAEIVGSGAEEYASYVRAERERFAAVIRETGGTLD
jgi:tripartite-type tricarboxylate transporter receptor subunit TctC